MSILNIIINRKIKEYQPVSASHYKSATYHICYNNQWIECNVFHILYHPVLILVSFNDSINIVYNANIYIKTKHLNGRKDISLELKLIQNIPLHDQSIWLFEVINAHLSLNLIEHWYLKRIYNYSQRKGANFIPNFTFDHYKKIVAMFVNPKKTYLISIKNDKIYHHFPIDLCAEISSYNFIGIRNSNKHASSLKINEEFYMSTAACENYEEIYKLGKFSNLNYKEQNNREQSAMTVLPDIYCAQKKVKLVDKLILEFQTIYVTKTIETSNFNHSKKPLFHLHKIWYMQLNNLKNIELVQN